MEITELQIILFALCGLSGITVLIFTLRKNNKGLDYNKIIRELNEQKEKDLNILDIRNKKIDKIEEKILKYKKDLGMRLFDEK